MNFKKFQSVVLSYNLRHYGFGSSNYFKRSLELTDDSPISVVSILKLSYEEFGLRKTILTNITLFLGLALILGGLDVLSFYVSNTLYSSLLHLIPFLLFVRKFDVLSQRGKHQTLLFFYLIITFIFHFYGLLSLLFIIMYENMIAITTLKGGLY